MFYYLIHLIYFIFKSYFKTSSVSIRHGVGGEEYVIDKLTRRSTVEDVISRIVKDLKLDKGRWIILEVKVLFYNCWVSNWCFQAHTLLAPLRWE